MSLLFYLWSKTAASNATADAAVGWAEGMAPSGVNDSARAMMASAAGFRDDNAGSLTTGGTSTAFTLTTNQVFDTLAHLSGQKLCVKFNATNGAAATLNVDTLGAKALQTLSGTAIPTGMILANSIWNVTYDNSIPAFIVHGIPAVLPATGFSGAITGADGSVSAPEYSFSSDTNTGLYRIGADNIGVAANGAKVLDIATTGLSVIGSATISSGFTVSGGAVSLPNTSVHVAAFNSDVFAAKSDQETASATTVAVSPGTQQFHPSAAKAWGFVTVSGGSPSLTASYNCTSISDDAVGLWTVTLTTNFSSANFAVVCCMEGASDPSFLSYIEVRAKTVSTIQFVLRTASGAANAVPQALDRSFHFVAYGDQ